MTKSIPYFHKTYRKPHSGWLKPVVWRSRYPVYGAMLWQSRHPTSMGLTGSHFRVLELVVSATFQQRRYPIYEMYTCKDLRHLNSRCCSKVDTWFLRDLQEATFRVPKLVGVRHTSEADTQHLRDAQCVVERYSGVNKPMIESFYKFVFMGCIDHTQISWV